MKKALMNASVASMIYKFNMQNIEMLEELGYQVDVACNFGKENPISKKDIEDFRKILKNKRIRVIKTKCPRSIFAIGNIITTYTQLKKIADRESYDLVHTQSPIGGVICRLAFRHAREKGTKVIYQAHGFYFYKGAPLLYWILYYPIEVICSRFTDVLITINEEDYTLAKKHMYGKKIVYIPGAGVDINKFENVKVDRNLKRKEIGVPEDAFLLLSVGELNDNKNHATIIKAIAKLHASNIYYAIAGTGAMKDSLVKLAISEGVQDNLKLLGYRNDVQELYHTADVFCFPSKREGLGLAAVEAMLSGLPIITSNIQGINDYSKNGITGYKCAPLDVNGFSEAIRNLHDDPDLRKKMGKYNRAYAKKYDQKSVLNYMYNVYGNL